MQPISRGESWRAFTLIELLVVIAIIAILATLMVSGLTRAKAMARNVVCKNNLRQLGLALASYVDDHKVYPPAYQASSTTRIESDILWNLLSPYLGARIPATPAPRAVKGVTTFTPVKSTEPMGGAPYHCSEKDNPWLPRNYDYGYNVSGVDFSSNRTNRLGLQGGRASVGILPDPGDAIKESNVREPADMVALGDTPGYNDSFPDGLVMRLGPYSPGFTGGLVGVGSQHRGQGNVIFCDLHLESDTPQRWSAPTDQARRRWNSDNEPHAELWPPKR